MPRSVLLENSEYDLRLISVDLALAANEFSASVEAPYEVIPVGNAPGSLPLDNAAVLAPSYFVRGLDPVELVHGSAEADIDYPDATFRERNDFNACELKALEYGSDIGLISTKAVERLRQHNVEFPSARVAQEALEPSAIHIRAGYRVVRIALGDHPTFSSCTVAANPKLIFDRPLMLQIGGVPRLDRHVLLHGYGSLK